MSAVEGKPDIERTAPRAARSRFLRRHRGLRYNTVEGALRERQALTWIAEAIGKWSRGFQKFAYTRRLGRIADSRNPTRAGHCRQRGAVRGYAVPL